MTEIDVRAAEIRAWLAEQLRSSAEWRRTKADTWSSDRRNETSAAALEDAADYVARVADWRNSNLAKIVGLAESLGVNDPWAEPDGMPWSVHSRKTAAAYFFDRRVRDRQPTRRTHEHLLDRLHSAMAHEDRWQWEAKNKRGQWAQAGKPVGDDHLSTDAHTSADGYPLLEDLTTSLQATRQDSAVVAHLRSIEEKLDRVLELLASA